MAVPALHLDWIDALTMIRRLVIFVLPALMGLSHAQQAAPSGTREVVAIPGPTNLQEIFYHAYRDIIEGNRRDLQEHRRLAENYRKAAEALAQQRPVDAKRVRDLRAIAILCDRLAAENQAVLEAFERGTTGPAMRDAMKQILVLEKLLSEAINQPVRREWLTFQEVDEFEERGGTYRTRRPGVLPYRRADWRVKGRAG